MKYQMSFVLGRRKHWVFFENSLTAILVWSALIPQEALDIECLENPNLPGAKWVSLEDLAKEAA